MDCRALLAMTEKKGRPPLFSLFSTFTLISATFISLSATASTSMEPPTPKPARDLADMVMKSLKEDQPSTGGAPSVSEPPGALSIPLPTPPIITGAPGKARFRFLDKTFAKVFTRTLNTNSRYRWGPLEIQVLRCHQAPSQKAGDDMVFIEVYDTTPTLMPTLIFKGWLSALYPGVSGIDHPLYDVWLEGCE